MTYAAVAAPRTGLSWADRFWPEPPDADAVVRQWAGDCPALSGCGNAVEVLSAVRRNPDEVLIHLISHAQAGNAVADHLLARTIAPKLRRMAGRDRHANFEDYLTHFWMRVHTYPLARRTYRVAANLVLDTLKSVVAERAPHEELPAEPRSVEWMIPSLPPETGLGRELLNAGLDLNIIDANTADILHSVYIEGLTGRQAALRHGVSAEMIRYRCSTYVRRLARRREMLLAQLAGSDQPRSMQQAA